MKRIGRDATLEERAVQEAPELVERAHARRRAHRRRLAPAARPEPEVTVRQVHPDIWAAALRLAGGDASRIKVLSMTRVEVT